jgi:two-component system, NtrC family, sensor histidine kinase HydH
MGKVSRPNKISSASYEALEAKVRELEVKLAISNESLLVESIKRDTAEKALQESEKRYGALASYVDESSAIIQRMEEELRQARKMEEVGKIMVPALVHDLGNLLGAIKSHAQFCMQNLNAPSPVEENIQVIYEGTQRADTLIRNFLDLFKFIKFDRLSDKPVNVNETVTRMWNTIKLEAFSRRVSFPLELGENLPEIRGDVERLERVFLNLFMNAIQAVPVEGEVTVQTRFLPAENVVEVKVTDDGPGVPEHIRQRIFEPFFTTKEEGTGLGLSICQLIVEQHKGTLTFDAGHPGETTFSVKLPVISKDELTTPPDDPNRCQSTIDGAEFADSSR